MKVRGANSEPQFRVRPVTRLNDQTCEPPKSFLLGHDEEALSTTTPAPSATQPAPSTAPMRVYLATHQTGTVPHVDYWIVASRINQSASCEDLLEEGGFLADVPPCLQQQG